MLSPSLPCFSPGGERMVPAPPRLESVFTVVTCKIKLPLKITRGASRTGAGCILFAIGLSRLPRPGELPSGAFGSGTSEPGEGAGPYPARLRLPGSRRARPPPCAASFSVGNTTTSRPRGALPACSALPACPAGPPGPCRSPGPAGWRAAPRPASPQRPRQGWCWASSASQLRPHRFGAERRENGQKVKRGEGAVRIFKREHDLKVFEECL